MSICCYILEVSTSEVFPHPQVLFLLPQGKIRQGFSLIVQIFFNNYLYFVLSYLSTLNQLILLSWPNYVFHKLSAHLPVHCKFGLKQYHHGKAWMLCCLKISSVGCRAMSRQLTSHMAYLVNWGDDSLSYHPSRGTGNF